jgi:crotonobetaine/carnitine-CoA ligase
VDDDVRTLGGLVAARAVQQPDRPVVRFEDSHLTYGELDERSNRFANALIGLALTKGNKAAVMLANRPEYLPAWVGMTKAGVVEVPINTGYKGDLLGYLLNQSECEAIVVDAEWLDRVAAIADHVETLRHVIVVGQPATDLPASLTLHHFEDFVAGGAAAAPDVEVGPFDVSVILFTSGTTGPSKGVVLTHNANFRLSENVIELMAYAKDEVLFTAFPLFHVNAKYTTVLPVMMVDGEAVIHSRFSASRFWDIMREEGVTAFNYMGALLMMLFKQDARPDDADNPVRRAYGAPAPITIYEDFQKRFGMQLVEVYGSTELGTATMNTVDDFVIGSCGKSVPYYEVRIHDEYDTPVAPGVQGEIVVRPTEPHVMIEEYYRMPEATLQAFRNLWFHTGDRGYMDEDGNFYYVDRMKDCIRRRGENISSWELEKVITSITAIEEAAAIGIPSELTEEEVMAVVKLKPGQTLEPVAILDVVQTRMPHFAVPRYVRFVDQLPKTPSQRIEKYKLREQGLTEDTWDRETLGYEVKR